MIPGQEARVWAHLAALANVRDEAAALVWLMSEYTPGICPEQRERLQAALEHARETRSAEEIAERMAA